MKRVVSSSWDHGDGKYLIVEHLAVPNDDVEHDELHEPVHGEADSGGTAIFFVCKGGHIV